MNETEKAIQKAEEQLRSTTKARNSRYDGHYEIEKLINERYNLLETDPNLPSRLTLLEDTGDSYKILSEILFRYE